MVGRLGDAVPASPPAGLGRRQGADGVAAPVSRIPPSERTRWIASNILPHEATLRIWLSSRRFPGLEIDDVIQDTYARLIQIDSVEAIRNPKSYLFQTAWSVLVSHVRHERVVPMQPLAEVSELALRAGVPSPEQLVLDRDELRRLSEALGALKGKIGDVFRLRRIHGLPQKEVARRLGLSESTVEKHLRRALLLLVEQFEHSGYGPPEASNVRDRDTKAGHGQSERERSR